ncbi:uncharacterized protein FTOL_13107 [Fusarium torulosum]|uniref:Uncharacterized protein n=1 Tax=Fusarium torulosum TaxID=33205 RepID=A0AAE8MLJ8_9HYPO|nr:uncharacterized protein FTOL_13107 [Fusarium torulosum]
MSPEADPVESSAEQAEAPPKKKPHRKVQIHKDDRDVIQVKQSSAIACILPLVKEHPDLYHQVVDRIKNTNLRLAWSSSSFYKDFMAWCRVSAQTSNARPDLEFFLAVLAVHDSLDLGTSKMNEEIRRLGLRVWAEEQLKARHPLPSIEEQSLSEAPQVEPRVKVEQRENTTLPQFRFEDGHNSIRRSTELDSSYQHTTGLKRPSLEHPAELTNKRMKIPIDPALAAADLSRLGVYGPSQQRIVLHHASMQTESDATLSQALGPILEVMKKMESRMQTFEEYTKDFAEHSRTLQDHSRVLSEMMERARDNNQLRSVNTNNVHQQQSHPQLHEIIPVHSAPRQPTAYFLGTNREPNNNGSIFTFH